MGQEAYNFIDRLSLAGQKYWQVLPLGPVNEKGCPYQSTSAFAGEPGYICRERFAEKDLPEESGEFQKFCRREAFWLEDYVLYTALSERFGKDWSGWEDDISAADPKAKAAWAEELAPRIDELKQEQYLFFSQWEEILSYAHEKGIKIIGDMPYSVAFESADCWAHRELFMIDSEGRQLAAAGAPPDYFAPEGQCWDNPLYDWQANRDEGYEWWLGRIAQQLRFFDVLRIDHMRGFESFYSIPADTRDPAQGHWEKGPGMDFFDAVNKEFGSERFIAEDLGYLTEEVHRLIADTGYPGMKVLQFAFDTGEENIYLPMNYQSDNCVVYTGTHDNDTTLGWYEKAEDWKKAFLAWYLKEKLGEAGAEDAGGEHAVCGMIRLAHSSRARLSIIPMQDYLRLGSEARINVPGTVDGNWCWQMKEDDFTEELAVEIAEMCRSYGR